MLDWLSQYNIYPENNDEHVMQELKERSRMEIRLPHLMIDIKQKIDSIQREELFKKVKAGKNPWAFEDGVQYVFVHYNGLLNFMGRRP